MNTNSEKLTAESRQADISPLTLSSICATNLCYPQNFFLGTIHFSLLRIFQSHGIFKISVPTIQKGRPIMRSKTQTPLPERLRLMECRVIDRASFSPVG